MYYFKKQLLLAIFFCGLLSTAFSQRIIKDSLSMIINEMAATNIYETSYTVGYSGKPSQQFYRFQQILRLASSKELMQTTLDNKNAVVRLYAYQALKQRGVVIPEMLTRKILNDNTKVKVLDGCQGVESTVAALAKQNYLNGENDFGAMTYY